MSGAEQFERTIDGVIMNAWRRYNLPTRVAARAADPAIKVARKLHTTKVWKSTTLRGKAGSLCDAARARAKQWGVDFTLTRDWVESKLEHGNCVLTGLPFYIGPATSFRSANPMSPSIDRIEAGGAYSPENCRIVILAVNTAMREWGEEVFATVARAYLKKLQGNQ